MGEGFAFLSLITHACSKKIKSWALHNTLRTEGPLIALESALAGRQYTKPLVHHSDRGVQYRSNDYSEMLHGRSIDIRMTQNGNPRGNAIAERVNGIFKHELDQLSVYATIAQAELEIQEAINIYNSIHLHISNHFLTPNQMHKQRELVPKKYRY